MEEARRELQAQRRAGVPRSWPRDTNWLSAVKELSEAAFLLGDLDVGPILSNCSSLSATASSSPRVR